MSFMTPSLSKKSVLEEKKKRSQNYYNCYGPERHFPIISTSIYYINTATPRDCLSNNAHATGITGGKKKKEPMLPRQLKK